MAQSAFEPSSKEEKTTTMAPTKLKCEFSTCSWVSHEGELDTVVKLMEMHFAANHKQEKAAKVTSAKAEKAKRPEIAAEMSDEDWAYFLSRWSSYKKATSLGGMMSTCS